MLQQRRKKKLKISHQKSLKRNDRADLSFEMVKAHHFLDFFKLHNYNNQRTPVTASH